MRISGGRSLMLARQKPQPELENGITTEARHTQRCFCQKLFLCVLSVSAVRYPQRKFFREAAPWYCHKRRPDPHPAHNAGAAPLRAPPTTASGSDRLIECTAR